MPAPADFYTFRGDIRPFGNGSPVAYRYDPTAFTAAAEDITQGELCAWDSTNRRVVRFVRAGEAGKFIGLSRESAKSIHKLGNQPALNLRELSVFSTGIHELIGKLGETYNHGDAIYMDSTATNAVTKVAGGGVQIGTIHNPQNLTIQGNVRVPVLIDEFTVTQT